MRGQGRDEMDVGCRKKTFNQLGKPGKFAIPGLVGPQKTSSKPADQVEDGRIKKDIARKRVLQCDRCTWEEQGCPR
eukprot:2685629-Pyramimonas_sp.AAC.1